jgi:hypothetical protein
MKYTDGNSGKYLVFRSLITFTDITMSSDSTSCLKMNYQSHHIHMRVPVKNTDGSVSLSTAPKIRFLGIASTVDHSTATSKETWLTIYNDIISTYNASPLGGRLGKLDLQMICRVLRGMCSDHANNEKALSEAWKELKNDLLLQELGEEHLQQLNQQLDELRELKQRWVAKKLDDASGFQAYMVLPPDERAAHDLACVHAMMRELGAEALNELIARRDIYREFLEAIKDLKSHPGWTNIEKNVYDVLNDGPTLTELAVLSIYHLFITILYTRRVREPEEVALNAISLGPLHGEIQDHCAILLKTPELVLDFDEEQYRIATFDGQPVARGEVMVEIKKLYDSGKLPYLCEMFIRFLEGAKSTWIRFSSEFAPRGLIDGLNDDEKGRIWLPATNDWNEGALGSFIVYM